MRLAVVGILTMVALSMARRRSPHLVSLSIVVLASNREIRRILDWFDGEFQPRTVISLAPLLVPLAGLTALPPRLIDGDDRCKSIGGFLLLPLFYGMAIGAGSFMPAVYAFSEYFAPIAIMAYVIAIRPTAREIHSLLDTLVLTAGAVALYGWIQFLLVPAWDEFWMASCGMGSIGKPEPGKVRVFSTLNAPGPAGRFLSFGLLPAMFCTHDRRLYGGVMSIIIASGMALTLVRSAWLATAIALLVFIFSASHGDKSRFAAYSVAIAIACSLALPYLPGAQRVEDRIATLGAMADDGSFQGRAELLSHEGLRLLIEPRGAGLGAVGTSVRLEGSDLGRAFDNGLLEFPLTFGLPMSVLFFVGLYKLFIRSRIDAPEFAGPDDLDINRMGRAYFIATLAALASNNVLSGAAALPAWMMIGMAVTIADQTRERWSLAYLAPVDNFKNRYAYATA